MDYLRDQHYDNDARTDEHTFQLDYTNPITKQHQIDAGVKYILRRNQSDSKYFKADDNNIYQPDNDLTSKFNQDQDILAAYADYQLKFGLSLAVRRVYVSNILLWMWNISICLTETSTVISMI